MKTLRISDKIHQKLIASLRTLMTAREEPHNKLMRKILE